MVTTTWNSSGGHLENCRGGGDGGSNGEWNSSIDCPEPGPLHYQLSYRIIGSIFVVVIFVVGLVGNTLVVVVVTRTKSLHTPTNCFLVSLAFADLLLLVSAALPTLLEYHFVVDRSLLGPAGCSLMVFCQYLAVDVSSLSMAAFTVERYVAICHPMMARVVCCSVGRAKRIAVGVWAVCVVYCAPWLGLVVAGAKTFADGTRVEHCKMRLPRPQYRPVFVTDLVVFYAFPLLLISVLYALIVRTLCKESIPGQEGGAAEGCGAGGGGGNCQRRCGRVLVGRQVTWPPPTQARDQRRSSSSIIGESVNLRRLNSNWKSRLQVLCAFVV